MPTTMKFDVLSGTQVTLNTTNYKETSISYGSYQYNFPTDSGTIALTKNIPDVSGFLTKTDAASTYVTITSADSTYAKKTDIPSAVTIDQTYSATSSNAQSGKAVAEAVAGKQNTITGGATTITSSNLTASKALISNASGKVAVSNTTSTELGYLSGTTSSVQTQLNGKQATLVSGTNIKTVNGTSILGSGNIDTYQSLAKTDGFYTTVSYSGTATPDGVSDGAFINFSLNIPIIDQLFSSSANWTSVSLYDLYTSLASDEYIPSTRVASDNSNSVSSVDGWFPATGSFINPSDNSMYFIYGWFIDKSRTAEAGTLFFMGRNLANNTFIFPLTIDSSYTATKVIGHSYHFVFYVDISH